MFQKPQGFNDAATGLEQSATLTQVAEKEV
jgi:hypothetical protein